MKYIIQESLKHQLENQHKGKNELLHRVGQNQEALLEMLESDAIGERKGKQKRGDKGKGEEGICCKFLVLCRFQYPYL